ncbi:hypothetical protein [Streptacidiphilus monticola]|uniref:Uncharacterized protein n=1 Tax=Streptacidiphilus monticola TaxID=2161674 RepID=A0ABW1G412_9ACTN
MNRNLKLLGWAGLLLALAFPAAAGHVLAWLTVVTGLLLAHPTAACTAGALVLLARALPRVRRRLTHAAGRRLAAQLAQHVAKFAPASST